MAIQSRWQVPVPEISLQNWLFGTTPLTHSDRKVFLDAEDPDGKYMTMSEFQLLSKRLGLGLQNVGIRPGDRVLVFSGNDLYFPVLFMGIIMAGGVFTGASPTFTSTELAYQLRDSAATVLVASTPLMQTALDAASIAGLPRERIFLYDQSSTGQEPSKLGPRHWTELLAEPRDAQHFHGADVPDPRSTTCSLNYSSGTTGKPKGVEITHYSYVANGEAVICHQQLYPDYEERIRDSRVLCFMPMYHAAGQTSYAVNFPKLGIPTYIMRSYTFEKMLQHIQDLRITRLGCAPPIMLALAKSPLSRKYDLGSITEITCGTAPLSKSIADEVQRLWPNGVHIYQGWGMTELTCTGTICHPQCTDMESVGEAAPNITIKLMNGNTEVTQTGGPGELWVSGPTVMKGYWRNPQATSETIVVDNDGSRWLKTGDVVRLDRSQPGALIYVVDRLKELIKVRGFQVAPAELENVLLQRQDIVDVGIVGVVINHGEVPRAYVVRNSDVTERELIEWVDTRVAKYKRLRGGVVFVESIPRTQSGKILRRVLRERAQREVGDHRTGPTFRSKLA